MSRRRMLVLVAAISIAGCSSARKPSSEQGENAPDTAVARCTGCHGDPANGNPAPPRSIRGATETTDLSVGAHQQHLRESGIRQPIDCSECHVVPQNISDPGHIDKATADLTFGPLASSGNVTPSYNRAADGTTATCTVYCHGASFTTSNGALHTPAWNKVDGSQAGCGTCHGIPPPPPHPPAANSTACSSCHPQTVNPDGSINVTSGRHINGLLDLAGGGGCTSCHGDPNRTPSEIAAAPPKDTKGNTATTARGVGAHQAHLTDGPIRAALACGACHVVPTDLSHINGVVDLTWSPLARTGGNTPAWNTSSLTCTNYCHGNPLWGGSKNAPVWTGGSGEAACGTCHGVPPPSPHPSVGSSPTVCGACHPGTVKSDGTIDIAGGKHINGAVDVTGGTCTACHGDPNRTNASIAAAPPKDVSGNTATTSPGVGAHIAHLTASTLVGTPIACGECHAVPTDVTHAGLPLNLTWGPLARAGGASPSFDTTALTCTNYCHGASTWGGSKNNPVWTQGSSQVSCGSCHGTPPPTGRHGLSEHSGFIQSCATCHGTNYSLSSVNKPTHVDGTKTILSGSAAPITSWTPPTSTTPGTCTASCHSPPTDVRSW